MKTIFSGIINFIIVLIVTIAIFATFLFLNINDKGIVTVGDGSIISINDNTMKGALNKGELIVVYKQPVENIKENDVVTYLYEKNNKVEILTGRVYLINNDSQQTNFVLKGDAQSEEEIVTINATNVVGKWNNKQKVLFVGPLYNFILSTTGFIVVITIPLVLLLGYIIIKLIKKQKQNKNNKEDNISLESEDRISEKEIITSNFEPIIDVINEEKIEESLDDDLEVL